MTQDAFKLLVWHLHYASLTIVLNVEYNHCLDAVGHVTKTEVYKTIQNMHALVKSDN